MPANSSDTSHPGPPGSGPRAIANPALWRTLLALTAVFVLLYQLGGRGLNEPDEGRYAEAGRGMMASGDYLTPQLNGVPHLAKPPLTYWLIAFSLKSLGVNEFAARLPVALAAMGTLLAVYLLGRRAAGEACGLWAAAVLLSSLLFLGVARLVTTDMILTCWITWSAWALWHWSESPGQGWRQAIWFFVFLGLGLITKGPVALLLPLFALAGMRWRSPELRIGRLGWGRGILIMLAVSLPWFVAVAWGRPEVWGYFLGRETVGRLLSEVHGRGEAWWYFVPVLAGGMLPWTPWLALSPLIRRSLPAREMRLLRMCLAWAGLGLLLFTLSRSKLPTYALPLTPPMALLVALTLVRLPQAVEALRLRRMSRVCSMLSALVVLGAGVAFAVIAPRRYELPVALSIIPAVVAAVAVLMILRNFAKHGLLRGAGTLAAGMLAVFVSLAAMVPRVERAMGGKTPLKFMAARILREDPQQEAAVVAVGKLPLGLSFYLERPLLWYRPDLAPSTSPPPAVFEYTAVAGNSPNVLGGAEKLRALLTGTRQVFCVASPEDAVALVRDFGLTELERESRRVLLVSPAPVNARESQP